MNYLEFYQNFKNAILIRKKDILLKYPHFDNKNLTYWQKKGYLTKIINGYYIFCENLLDIGDLYFISNNIYFPSYISTYQALNYYNIIPEQVVSMTAVSTNKTNTYHTDIGNFLYQNIQKKLFWGYKIIKINNIEFYIADIEKTILDFFYLNKKYRTLEDILELRFDLQLLKKSLNQKKLHKYLKIFANQTLEKIILILLNLIKNA